jgi:predicted nucleotidyltransferase
MIDLAPEAMGIVREILDTHVPDREVRAFGSRVTGSAQKFSDLDLAVLGTEALDRAVLSTLKEAFAESDLVISVDVLDWNRLDESFQAVISEGCEVMKA